MALSVRRWVGVSVPCGGGRDGLEGGLSHAYASFRVLTNRTTGVGANKVIEGLNSPRKEEGRG